MVWIAFLGAAVVAWRGEHLRMDILSRRCPPRAQLALRLGANSPTAQIPMWLPHSGVAAGFAPGLFDSVEHAQRVFGDPEVRKRLATFGAAKGVEPLFTFANGPLMLLSHKPARSVDDLKGQKIRVPGGAPLHLEPFRKLGASPLSMPLGEVMPAMQNRAIDGFTAAFVVFVAFKYHDVAKTATELPGSFLIASGLVNRAFFKSLGDLEPMVREEARKAGEIFATGASADVKRIRGAWEKNGGETLTLPPAEAKRYLEQATSALPPILAADRQLKEDYDALVAAAKRGRRPARFGS